MRTRVHHLLGAVLSSAVAISPHDVTAQGSPSPCSLLTSAEVNAAFGVQARPPAEVNTLAQIGPLRGQTIRSCVWLTGPQGGVTLAIAPAVPGGTASNSNQAADALKIYDGLKAQGWTVDNSVVGNARCTATAPPPAFKRPGFMTMCMAEAKGIALTMSSPFATTAVPADSVKLLIDAAIARLP